ncbi:MAG TPA: AgmX/PglI C-terminal domain-containing protein [Kofleriaceae bacterium]|nr:AgmX/PglI C-terminal domain-containing protein [Kofleriaceae bacterium]
MAGAKIPLTFRIFKGNTFVREEVLTQAVIKVGKLSSSHLRLDDESVSRMHAVIEVSGPDDISIIDLGSTKGTVVNGQKVNKAKLQDGDLIALGDLRIELAVGEGAEDDQPTRVTQAPIAPAPSAPPPIRAPQPPPAAAAPPPVAPPRPAAPVPPPQVAAPPPSFSAPPSFSPPPGARAPGAVPIAPAAPFGAARPPLGAPPAGAPMDFLGTDVPGAQAVEIAAMLGESVVGVKHVINPRGGKTAMATYVLFAVGAALLLMAAIAFGVGVNNAQYNQDKKAEYLAEGKPLFEFRPRRLTLAYDFMAFGGLAGGIFCLTFGLIRYRNEQEDPYFRIGTADDVDFAVDGAPSESFPLVAPVGDDFLFNFFPTMDGEMVIDGKSTPLAELAGQGLARPSQAVAGSLEASIPQGARFRVRTGLSTFLVSSVPRPRKYPVPFLATFDSAVLPYLGGSAALLLGILFIAWWGLLSGDTLALNLIGDQDRLSSVDSKAYEDPKQEEQENKGDDEAAGGTGTKMALAEGQMGKKESTRQAGQYAMKKTADTPQLAKKQAIDEATQAGFLGENSALQGAAFASLTGTADFSSGFDDRDVYGGLVGNEVGEMYGGFGFGVSGVGPGGGGTGWGTIGTGRYGTIGHGSGTGSGYGTGSGRGGMRGRTARVPKVRIGVASTTGDLDKNIIRRYIRRKLPQITYCYEKQLVVKPGLHGTVVTQFQISPMGTVIQAAASGMGDSTVEKCVGNVIKSIKFPRPKGGGLVNVRYPFTFQAAGA